MTASVKDSSSSLKRENSHHLVLIKDLGWTCKPCKVDIRKILGNYRSGSAVNIQNGLSATSCTAISTVVVDEVTNTCDAPLIDTYAAAVRANSEPIDI